MTRQHFRVSEINKLIGKLARLAKGARWMYHLLTHLYSSVARALARNKAFLLEQDDNLKELVATDYGKKFKGNQARELSFALKKVAHKIHHANTKHSFTHHMRMELNFIQSLVQNEHGVKWENPIAFIITRDPTATSYGDSCLEACGSYSI